MQKQYFQEKDIWSYAAQLLNVVEHLHKQNVIHRDIKTLNIFLADNYKLKLGDLGVSKM